MRRSRLALGVVVLSLVLPVGAARAHQQSTEQQPVRALPAVGPDLSPMGKATALARQTGKRVELTGLRDETGEVYANPDGTKTMEQHALPVRVRQGNTWVAPDPTLRRMPDGTVRPRATVSPLVLSGGGDKDLLTIGKPGERVRMGWPGRLPAPRLQGSTATYPEVLPGVDLRIVVGSNDFQHLLVVKNRQAAQALGTLRYPVSGEGLRIGLGKDGGTTATDKTGRVVFGAPPPLMWDASSRHARLGISLAGQRMVLTPDRKLLTDPKAEFPLYVDPSMSGTLVNWLHVNVAMGAQNAWNYDRNDEGAKVGRAYGAPSNLYRSMFLLRTTNGSQTIAGSTIVSATFRITLNKSPTGTPTPVALWSLSDLNPAAYVDWNNSGGFWKLNLATVSGEAYPWTEDNPMEFSTEALRKVVQTVADNRATTVSLGLRAPDENNQSQWKKFLPNTAVLAITYNTAPRMPKSLNFTRPKPCAPASAPTAITTTQPQFAAVANDPDAGDNVTTTLQILDQAGTMVHSADVGPTVSGAAFSWPAVPAGKLAQNTTYHYRAVTRDAITSGPPTPDCYFTVDSVRPSVPVVQSADYPDGEPTLYTFVPGQLTFRPGSAADTDVAEYAYGFQQDKVTMRVKAGPDGSATIPVTISPDPGQVPSKRLYVKAVDRAGNVSTTRQSWDLEALDRTAQDPGPPFTRTRGDVNGDGKADVTAVFDQGYGRTAVWNVTAAGGSAFYTGYIGWDSGEGGGFNLYRTRPVQGDFDGNGRGDLALFREGAGRQVSLYDLVSDGNRYDAQAAVWTSPSNSWPLSTARVIGGDVDGDGKDDIVVQNAGTADNWSALVFRGTDGLKTPVTWATSATGNPWAGSTPLLADVDGDGRDDLLSMRNLTGCRTTVDLYRSTGTGFAPATTIYDSGAGNFCWEKSRPAVADVDGDHKDDIVALYEYGATDAGLTVFRSTGSALTAASWWRRTGELDLSKATLAAGDYDGDGKGDAAVLYAGGAIGDRQVYTFHSTGTAFADKVLGWGGEVGAVTGPKFDIERRDYELVNRNSGKCLRVASTADNAAYTQSSCAALDLNARLHIDAIAGTDQYALKPVATATGAGPIKCADLGGWSMADGAPLIQYPCGNGDPTANQQVTLDYVDGTSYDTVVQLRLAHSGKCVSVRDGSTVDGAVIEQQTCGQAANQQWILRPAFNPVQLGGDGTPRHRTEAATSTTQVLDITDCHTEDGADVRMWAWVSGSPCQGWQLQSIGDDVYKIVDPHSAKALDVEGCSKVPLATITIWTSNDSECQRWRIEPSPGGSYSVIQVSSGLSLDVAGCSSAQGANVITWFYHGGPCQRWIFRRL